MVYLRSTWLRLLGLVVLAGVPLALPQFLSGYDLYIAVAILILALFTTSFNLLLGYAGMMSFGHAAYFALGAYGSGLLFRELNVPMPLAFAAAPFIAALGAAAVGYFCVRRAHAYFIMLTLAFAQILYAIIFKWYSFTGGDNGLTGLRPPEVLRSAEGYYYFTLVIVGVCLAVMYRMVHSPFGNALKAIRENPIRAEAVGISVWVYRWVAFTLAGFFAGIAGALNAFYQRSAHPEFAFWTKSAEPMAAAILGSIHNFFGPLLGSVIFVALHRLVTRFTEHWLVVVGALVIVVVLGFPRGILGINIRNLSWKGLLPWPRT